MKLNHTREWMTSIVVALLMLTTVQGLARNAAAVKVYVQPFCKFSFNCPARARTLLPTEEGTSQGNKRDSVSVHWKQGELTVRLMKMSMEKAIEETDALQKDDKGNWVRYGRFDSKGLAKTVRFANLHGLYGVSMCGVSDSTGFHAAGGQCLSGFLTDGKQTAYFETDGLFPVDSVVKIVMPSFKFAK